MKKETKKVYEDYIKNNRIDYRTEKMIAYHYLSLGEQVIDKLTPQDIEETVFQEQKKQEAAEKEGKIYMIDPSFTEYLLKAVRALYEIPSQYRYDILKEML